MTLAVQFVWTPEVKAIAAKLERRVDRAVPFPPRPRLGERIRVLPRRAIALLEDLRQGDLFRR